MNKVIAIEAITLDGVMQGPGRPDEDRRDDFEYGGWAATYNDPLMQKVISKRIGNSWSLLVGRITYEDFASFWPNQPQPNPFTEVLNNVEKFVVSTTLTEPLNWQKSILLKGNIHDAITKLKKEHQKTLVIFGSGSLVQSLEQSNLIDEYVLQIHPLVLGKGRHLFPDGSPLTKFILLDSITTSTGVIIATYRHA